MCCDRRNWTKLEHVPLLNATRKPGVTLHACPGINRCTSNVSYSQLLSTGTSATPLASHHSSARPSQPPLTHMRSALTAPTLTWMHPLGSITSHSTGNQLRPAAQRRSCECTAAAALAGATCAKDHISGSFHHLLLAPPVMRQASGSLHHC
jgi:hypothetical protein